MLDDNEFRLDAYTASVPEDPTTLVTELADILEDARYKGVRLEAFKPRHYDQGVRILDDHGQLCAVQHGGRNPLPLVECQGPQACTIGGYLRVAHPEHTVSRMDSRIDLRAAGLFDAVYPRFVEIARAHGLAKEQGGDWFDSDGGRTLYLGSAKAARRVRLYEKGKKLRKEGHPDADPDHVRAEVQYRPEHAPQKAAAASLGEREVWGTSPWLIECLEAYAGQTADPVQLRRYRPPDYERSRHWLLMQYGAVLRAWADDCGGFEHLGINIEYSLRDLDKLQRDRAQERRKDREQRRAA